MEFKSLEAALPFAGMVMVILAQVSNMVVIKAAMSQGMNKNVIIVYSSALSTLILFPCSFIFHRSARPPLTLDILRSFILLAVFGSPTLGTAVLNLIPAFTFILAVIFRIEKLDWRRSSSQAQLIGTIVSIAGAFVVTFYKGPALMKTKTPPSLAISPHHQPLSQQSNWIFGGLFLAVEALAISASYILQALVLKKYPHVLLIMFYVGFVATIMSTIYSLIVVEEPSDWRLRLDMGLVAVLYSAVVGIVFRVSLVIWCLWKTGPLFVSMFKPLAIIFAVVMSVVFLGDVLCLGSLIGAVIIVTGFYTVMWGKANEKDAIVGMDNNGVEEECLVSSSERVPLLQNKIEDIH